MSVRVRVWRSLVCFTVTWVPALSCLSMKNQETLGCGSPATWQLITTLFPGPLGMLSVSTVMTGVSREQGVSSHLTSYSNLHCTTSLISAMAASPTPLSAVQR